MTPHELVDVSNSPGSKKIFGTDTGGYKDWQDGESFIQGSQPLIKAFLSASGSWAWNHALGFRPIVDIYNENWEKMLAYVDHTDENNLAVEHLYNETGYLVIR